MTLLSCPASLGRTQHQQKGGGSATKIHSHLPSKQAGWRRFSTVLPHTVFMPLAVTAATPLDLNSLYTVQRRLQDDLLGCEAMWTIFVAASMSYRYRTRLRPFPRCCQSIDHICQTLGEIPRLEFLHQQLLLCDYRGCTPKVIRLLSEVLVEQGKRVSLSSLRTCEFAELYSNLGMPTPARQPTQIFEVRTGHQNRRAETYKLLRKQNKEAVRLGFYGCQLEKLYALLNDDQLPEVEDLELTSDVNEALANSKAQAGLGGSRCGSILRCVAVVEFVFMGNETSPDKKHVIVSQPETMQVSYLMIYGQSCDDYEAEMRLLPQSGRKLMNWIGNFEQDALSLGISLLIVSSVSHFGGSFFRLFARTGFHILKRGLM